MRQLIWFTWNYSGMRRNQLSLHMRVLWNKLKFINNQTHYENTIATLSSHQQYYVCYAMLCYAKSLQLCLTLCDPTDGSPPGSPVPGILQARTLEWVAISFSNAWKGKEKVKSFSRVRLLATPWTAAHQAPPSMGFSRQVYWSGVPLPSPYGRLHWLNFKY